MSYVKNLEVDEIRNGFLVTSDRKRLWNTEIELILEFARVCEKYNLKWFAAFGTMLGAARHQGFIPWDDDVDLVLSREDYEKLKQIAPTEFRYPYYFDFWYDNIDPTIYELGWPTVAFAKLRDLRTTLIEFPDRVNDKQGIWIDIFPLDSAPPFNDNPKSEELYRDFKLLQDLFFVSCMPNIAQEFLQNPSKYKFLLHPKQVAEFLKLPLRQRGKIYEDRLIQFPRNTKFVSPMASIPIGRNVTTMVCERNIWNDPIYLQFEEVSLPVPKEFDKILRGVYGNWHKMVFTHSHAKETSIDVPFKQYFEMRNRPDEISNRSRSLNQNLHFDEIRNGSIVTSWKKKFWKIQLDLILELNRVYEKLDLKFWAIDQTLFAARKIHGFDPSNDFVTFRMTRKSFKKLEKFEFRYPFKLVENRLMDERTSMIQFPEEKDRAQGIFIEIKVTDQIPNEIEYLPFEFISIPTPKNFETPDRIEKKFDGAISADISYKEYFSQMNR